MFLTWEGLISTAHIEINKAPKRKEALEYLQKCLQGDIHNSRY